MKIFEEYTTPAETDDDTLLVIRTAIKNMRPMEQRLWIDYVESGTFAALARKYNVSAPTAKTYIMRLRDKILDALNEDAERLNNALNTKETEDEYILDDDTDSGLCDPRF